MPGIIHSEYGSVAHQSNLYDATVEQSAAFAQHLQGLWRQAFTVQHLGSTELASMVHYVALRFSSVSSCFRMWACVQPSQAVSYGVGEGV